VFFNRKFLKKSQSKALKGRHKLTLGVSPSLKMPQIIKPCKGKILTTALKLILIILLTTKKNVKYDDKKHKYKIIKRNATPSGLS